MLSASEVSFSRWSTIQIYLPLPLSNVNVHVNKPYISTRALYSLLETQMLSYFASLLIVFVHL